VTRRLLFVAVLALAVGFLAAGGRIWLKAQLAQYLLRRAWAATDAGAGTVKPWPWADTWPVARLVAPRHDVDLVVLADASGRTMAFGPGHVPGTAAPGAPGHTVLTGHRDTAFRFLRALAAGDELRVLAPGGAERRYAVVETRVVDAGDTWVLHETPDDRLTLVTCYPFDALVPGGPLRYVVRAGRLDAGPGHTPGER
jgi:sortase A